MSASWRSPASPRTSGSQELYDPVAAAGLGQSRPVGAGGAEPGEERRRGGDRRRGANGEIMLTTGFQHGMRLAVPGSDRAADLPLLVAVRDNGAGHSRRHQARICSTVRDLQAHRQRPWAGAGGQDRRRPWRADRGRQPAAAAPNSACTCCRSCTRRSRADRSAMTPPTVLIADDDRSIRTVLTQALGPLGLPGAQHRQRRDAVALGGGRRGRSGHHRRGDAGRERARPDPAHQADPARSAHRRDERADRR